MKEHWQNVYQSKKEYQVSWFQSHLNQSLDLILGSGIGPEAQIIDIGGGASTLVDDLQNKGFQNLSVLDLSAAALGASKKRLGSSANQISWIEGDITNIQLPECHFDLWHDRAVFHFMTKADARKAYLEALEKSLKPGGFVVMATFSLEGPQKCSGLEVVRYSRESLCSELGANYQLIKSVKESHQTPFGTTQEFLYSCFKKMVL